MVSIINHVSVLCLQPRSRYGVFTILLFSRLEQATKITSVVFTKFLQTIYVDIIIELD